MHETNHMIIGWNELTDEQVDAVAHHAGEIVERFKLMRGPFINYGPMWHQRRIDEHATAIRRILGFIPALMMTAVEEQAVRALEQRGALTIYEEILG